MAEADGLVTPVDGDRIQIHSGKEMDKAVKLILIVLILL